MTRLVSVQDFNALDADGTILIGESINDFNHFSTDLHAYSTLDASTMKQTLLVPSEKAPGKRIVLSPVGSLDGDVDDVRRYGEAGASAIKRCKSAGIRKPVIWIQNPLNATRDQYKYYVEVTLLGMLQELYVPLQTRELLSPETISELYVLAPQKLLDYVQAIEKGRWIGRDIGGSDPERMSPYACAAYIEKEFAGTNIKATIIKDHGILQKEYPLLFAVSRASLKTQHQPCVVRLEYHASDQEKVRENLFLIGKGVTYDTGGADIKHGGAMRGMSRDKCGAANVCGFLKTVSILQPPINVIADLGFVRNASGPENYVSDELIVSRAGVRVLVGNTDAEGRMVMTDLLCSAKERACQPQYARTPTRLFTVATLTGHSIRAVGFGYSISLDNGPARKNGVSKRLFDSGHLLGDPFETSTLRREDYQLVSSSGPQDVFQANEKPSTQTNRGHQYPAAFMVIASGLDKHGLNSSQPLCYTHVDIAPSAEVPPSGLGLAPVTGSPIAAFTHTFCF